METRTARKDNDQAFCWEQIAKTNPAFRISRIFAPRHCADKLLPVYALFSAVEHICSGISDEDVARSKLNWWYSEYLQSNPSDSRHPILKELNRTGALEQLGRENVEQLIAGAESRLYANPPPDMDALRDLCTELHRPQFSLEIDVSGVDESQLAIEDGVLACNGLLQLIRESIHSKERGGYWWVPLNSMARHGVSREKIAAGPASDAATDLMKEILAASRSWGCESAERRQGKKSERASARHLFAIHGLYSRKLRTLEGTAPSQFAFELGKISPADLLETWKSARRAQ